MAQRDAGNDCFKRRGEMQRIRQDVAAQGESDGEEDVDPVGVDAGA